ncbi:M48 family metalloprotease [Nonomuraea endophytica]|uniref:M48 family metalloprotease n=1 Tax=Nonomuraea endophytica TaxID=714136 RepID=UPI0037C8D6AF
MSACPHDPGPVRYRLSGVVHQIQLAAGTAAAGVLVAPGLGDNALALPPTPCGRAPIIAVGPDLLSQARTPVLTATLAHELAHHELGHHRGGLEGVLTHLRDGSFLIAATGTLLQVLGSMTGSPSGPALWWVMAALLVLSLAAGLVVARRNRLKEYDADYRAGEILDLNGLPGQDLLTAMLTDLDRPRDDAYTLIGWLFGDHPTDLARLRVLRSGRRAPRLLWDTAGCCVATAERLLTRGHRQVHRSDGTRCRPRQRQLLPSWHRPIEWETAVSYDSAVAEQHPS